MRNWLFNKRLDLIFLFIPVWMCWMISFILPDTVLEAEVSLWVWVVVVIGIDVSHVWSSIHRTYLDKEEFALHKSILIVAPILAFGLSFMLAFISIDLFWRCLAYVAVYHFIKQQYGFMRIYKAKSQDFRNKKLSDEFIIYLSMLYPVFYWHLSSDRAFAWFVQGDFVKIPFSTSLSALLPVGNGIYLGLILFWLLEELTFSKRNNRKLPLGKILWILTTTGNWFLGIVYFNSDLVFTLTNVVAHGVPYLTLVVYYQAKKRSIQANKLSLGRNFRIATVIVASVVVLALSEEYLWDLLVYQENEAFFSAILAYPIAEPGLWLQLLAIGLLAVPQVTHYILDGFIWKNNDKNPYLKRILFE